MSTLAKCGACSTNLVDRFVEITEGKSYCPCGVWFDLRVIEFVDPDTNQALNIGLTVTRVYGELRFMCAVIEEGRK